MGSLTYDETFKFKLSSDLLNKISTLAEQNDVSMSEIVRHAIDIVGSDDAVVVPLTRKEREFIEGICETTGVQPSDAIKMVLLSYHTLMSSPLWKLIKPIDKILDEMRNEQDERE